MPTPPKPPAPKGPGGGFFSAKVAGIPVWMLTAGAGVLVLLYLRSRHAAQAAATDTTGAASVPLNGTGGGAGGGLGGTATANFGTNQDWESAALSALIGSGADPITAAQALSDYLLGNPLSQAEAQLIDSALRLVGAPPTLPTTSITGQNTSTTTSAAPPVGAYTGDTTGLAPIPGLPGQAFYWPTPVSASGYGGAPASVIPVADLSPYAQPLATQNIPYVAGQAPAIGPEQSTTLQYINPTSGQPVTETINYAR